MKVKVLDIYGYRILNYEKVERTECGGEILRLVYEDGNSHEILVEEGSVVIEL